MQIKKSMTQLTSNRLSPKFKGTTLHLIIDWIDKMRIYEELTPQTSHWPNNIKKVMLQNMVSDLPVFKTMKVTENIDIAQGRRLISYHNYVHRLQNVAAQHDESMISPKRANHIVNIHKFENDFVYEYKNDDDIFFDKDLYDFNQDLEVNQFNFKQQFRSRPSLPRDTWNKMCKRDQISWDSVSDFGKWAIF